MTENGENTETIEGKLDNVDIQILKLLRAGKKHREIARILKIGTRTVARRLSKPDVILYQEQLNKNALELLAEYERQIMTRLINIALRSEDESVAARTGCKLMDKVIPNKAEIDFTKPIEIEEKINLENLTAAELKKWRSLLNKSKKSPKGK